MRGEFVGVWAETWREIWLPLIEQSLAEDDEGLPDDIFCELYRALAPALSPRPSVEDLADIIDNPVPTRQPREGRATRDRDARYGGHVNSAHGFYSVSHPRAQPRRDVSGDMR